MNVFVLCTGRCGSTTFIKACGHITNYSAGHETRSGLVGVERMEYPPNHMEADNRLSWFLGRLENAYGDAATYVHLSRDREQTARSFLARYGSGIVGAYQRDILMGIVSGAEPLTVCLDYVDTVTANIEAFLRGKSRVYRMRLETARSDYAGFWRWIGAEGDLAAALAEWEVRHNASVGTA